LEVLVIFLGLVVIWADDILRIERHLAANFRINSRLLIGWVIFIMAGTLWGGVIFCISVVSATSSYADDIAYIKILYEQKPMWLPQP
jgi:hypothetical protein